MQFDESVKKIESVLQRKPFSIILVLTVLSIAFVVRLILASTVQHPGHADYAFYYTVAENIVNGKGFQIDYIWNYLGNPTSITHSSNDYWMPLTSIIISLSMSVFGKSLFAALLPSIVAGLLLSVLAYFVSRMYSDSPLVAFFSFSLILFLPSLFTYSLLTDSTIYYALFVSSSLLFMIKSWTHPRFLLLASVFAGLAHLTRQDGVLLILVLIGVICFSRQPIRTKLKYALLSIGLYALILSPLMIANYRIFGAPFPPGPSKTMFLTEYEDIYSYSKELSLHSYLEWGLSNIVLSKLRVAVLNVATLHNFLGDFLSVFWVVGILYFITFPDRRQRWVKYWPPLLFLGILFVFYTVIATFPAEQGGFMRSSMAITPFLIVMAVETIHRIVPSRSVVSLSILLVLSLCLFRSIQSSQAMIASNAQIGEELATLKEILINDVHEQGYDDVVIMTRNPWEVYYSTGYKAIQIPNESLEVIYQVARKFGANYLLLPAPREALLPVYWGESLDDRFQLVAEIPNSRLKLFRIRDGK